MAIGRPRSLCSKGPMRLRCPHAARPPAAAPCAIDSATCTASLQIEVLCAAAFIRKGLIDAAPRHACVTVFP